MARRAGCGGTTWTWTRALAYISRQVQHGADGRLRACPLKTIADQLGHSSVVLTADTYLSIAVELGLKAAADAARLVLNAGKSPPGSGTSAGAAPPYSSKSPPDPSDITGTR